MYDKYFSTFSGIGGFELGLGGKWECVGFSEIDKYAAQIYQKHFPYEKCKACSNREFLQSKAPEDIHRKRTNLKVGQIRITNCHCKHKPYGDITKIDADVLPDFDLLVGGFPCQAFSIAGKRGGFEDTRGTMFFELARILRTKVPRLFVFENVKGLLSHDGGKSFATIIQTLDELGYDCQWQVLNSKNHGVPQNRERVFIVGHLRGTPRPQVFPFGENDRKVDVIQGQPTNTLTARYEGAQATGSYVIESELNAQDIAQLNKPKHSNDRVYGTNGLSPTLNTMQRGNRQPFVKSTSAIRRLTPIECERLQGFPDGWTADGIDGVVSDTQRYKTLGNAVTVNVIRDIVARLRV